MFWLVRMTDVELDLYADDLEQDFNQAKVSKIESEKPRKFLTIFAP